VSTSRKHPSSDPRSTTGEALATRSLILNWRDELMTRLISGLNLAFSTVVLYFTSLAEQNGEGPIGPFTDPDG